MSAISPSGPRLFKQASAKSNRSILLNAVEYCVFPGAVNREAKQRVLEEIARVEARHFLILFRDARCQFRALYWYVTLPLPLLSPLCLPLPYLYFYLYLSIIFTSAFGPVRAVVSTILNCNSRRDLL